MSVTTRRENRHYTYALDTTITMSRNDRPRDLTPNRKTVFHNPHRVITRKLVVITSILLTYLGQSYAYAAIDLHQQEMWKLYAHMRIGSTKEFILLMTYGLWKAIGTQLHIMIDLLQEGYHKSLI